MELLLVAPALVAFLAGVRWGRRVSGGALGLFVFGVLATIYMAQSSYQASPDGDGHLLRGGIGFASTLGALAAIGPLIFTRWYLALAASAAAIALFVLSGMPMFFACVLFGACTAYP